MRHPEPGSRSCSNGSRAAIIRERTESPIEDRIKFLSIDAFKAYFANKTYRKVTVNPFAREETVSYPKIAPAWLHSKLRRTYEGVESILPPQASLALPSITIYGAAFPGCQT